MPQFALPLGPKIRWDNRRNSRVRITHQPVTIGGSPPLRCNLELPRNCFDSFDEGMEAMRSLAQTLLAKVPTLHNRKNRGPIILTCPAPQNSRSRIKITYPPETLSSLKERIASWNTTWAGFAKNMDAVEALGCHLHSSVFPQISALIRTTPRSRIDQRRLRLVLPAALQACQLLVSKRNMNGHRIQRALQHILDEDEDLQFWCELARQINWSNQHALIIGLVDRALRPAFERLAVPRLINRKNPRNPTRALREYLYRSSPFRDSLSEIFGKKQDLVRHYMKWAEDTFLGPPGAAARFFKLIP